MSLFHLLIPLVVLVSCTQALPRQDSEKLEIKSKVATGTAGAIVTSSPTATRIGAEILRMGGNAVDAAIAATFALWTDPTNTSLAGRGHLLLRTSDGEVFALDGATQVPSTYKGGKKRQGFGTVPVPGLLKLLGEMHRRWGKISWKKLVEPSQKATEEGFIVPSHLGAILQTMNEKLKEDEALRGLYLHDDLSSYKEGETMRNPAMGHFLKEIAEYGAEVLYRGKIAKSLKLPEKDLRRYRVTPGEIEEFSFEGWKIYSAAGNAGGNFMRRMFDSYAKDPEKEKRPLAIARAIQVGLSLKPEELDPEANAPEGDTTHLSVIDKEGMTVSLTSSIGPRFGSLVGNAQYGFPYAFSYAMGSGRAKPGDRDETKVSPTIALGPENQIVVLGAAGDRRIPSSVFQVLLNRIEGRALGEAVSLPRMAFKRKKFRLQEGYSPQHFELVKSLGFPVTWTGRSHIRHTGIVHAAELSLDERSFTAVADPAYDGVPAVP